MADQFDKSSEQKAAELEMRVDELERMWSRLKWAGVLLGTAVLIVAGVGFVEIPRAASEKARSMAEKAAKSKASEAVEKTVGPAVSAELDKQQARAKKAATEAQKALARVLKSEKGISATDVKALNDRINTDVVVCAAYAFVHAREGSPDYKLTQSGLGRVDHRGEGIKEVTREGAGRYRIDLRFMVEKDDLVIATSIMGYSVRVGAELDYINIIVTNTANKPEDDNVQVVLLRPRQTL